MATFPDIAPDYGISKQSAPIVRKVQFGDGYEQRLRYGLNQNPKTWNLTWNNITEADSDTIESFLDARADDGEAFEWMPPDVPATSSFLLTEDGDYLLFEDGSKIITKAADATVYKWVCEQWDKTMVAYNRNTITAAFRQVFEP